MTFANIPKEFLKSSMDILSFLRDRWSPSKWSGDYSMEPGTIDLLLEAARWTPSAGNSQPWSFIVAQRGDSNHAILVPSLARSSSAWAPSASLLIVNLCHVHVEGTDWEYSEFAMYDLGQAVANMTIQAASLGLAVHQFAAFDNDAVRRDFKITDEWRVVTISAIGRIPPGELPHGQVKYNGEVLPRDRRSLKDIQWNVEIKRGSHTP